jgi:ring-1,2-phenylacetyl-CoA epoxidase subunit PaaC
MHIADCDLILSQRLLEWIGHAPMLEEDLALANVALDLLGQARHWYAILVKADPDLGDEDQLAMKRDVPLWRNLLLVELANGDFADTLVRQMLFDQYHLLLLEHLAVSADSEIRAVAAKAVKEVTYHCRRSTDLLVRLGDGSAESHARCERALERTWPHAAEMFVDFEGDLMLSETQVAPLPSSLRAPFMEAVGKTLMDATLTERELGVARIGGRHARHSEQLGYMLADLQFLQRAYPGAVW